MSSRSELPAAGIDKPLRHRKNEAVYHALRRSILLGDTACGAAIGEQQLAARMGCSQGTVREALLRLEQDGLVLRRGYRGTIVATTTLEEAAQMVRVRVGLETEAVRRAVVRLGPAEYASLQVVVEHMGAAEREGDAYALSELDRDFHLGVFRAAELPALEPILQRCMLHMHRHTFGVGKQPLAADKGGMERSSAQHRRLLQVLQQAEPEQAADAVHRHIEAVIAFWSPEVSRVLGDATPS